MAFLYFYPYEWINKPWVRLLLCIMLILGLVFAIAFFIIMFFLPHSPPNTFIKFGLERDFVITKNEAGYKGYIRFETLSDFKRFQHPNPQRQLPPTIIAKIVLKITKNTKFTHNIEIALFDKDRALIVKNVLYEKNLRPTIMGYSYNMLALSVFVDSKREVSYFKYNLVHR